MEVTIYSGSSVLSPGSPTDKTDTIHKVLSPLSASELGGGCIRCIGLNYRAHAEEAGLDLPKVPPVFLKPSTALANPYPTDTTPLPTLSVESESGDYESELAVVLGREVKNVREEEVKDGMLGRGRAAGVLLGYTAANDVSCRKAQFDQSQWCYSKSFDGACPLGESFHLGIRFGCTRWHPGKPPTGSSVRGIRARGVSLDGKRNPKLTASVL